MGLGKGISFHVRYQDGSGPQNLVGSHPTDPISMVAIGVVGVSHVIGRVQSPGAKEMMVRFLKSAG